MFGFKRLSEEERQEIDLERKKEKLEFHILRCTEGRAALKKEQLHYKTELQSL